MNNQLEKIVEALNLAETCILRQQAEIERLKQEANLLRTMIDELVGPARAALKGEDDGR